MLADRSDCPSEESLCFTFKTEAECKTIKQNVDDAQGSFFGK